MKYPIDKEKLIKECEQYFGYVADDKTIKIVQLYVDGMKLISKG